MLWIPLAILTAVAEATKDLFGKKSLQKIDEYSVSWALRFFALPLPLILLLFFPIPSLNSSFWLALGVSGPLNVIATILYMKAIKHSPLSLTTPMLTFTPVFLLVTSPLILGEFPDLSGAIGILLIVLGAYLLSIGEIRRGLLAPFRALAKEKGPLMMLGVAFIWSITTNYDKIGIVNSNPLFWVVALNAFLTAVFSLIIFSRRRIRSNHSNTKADFNIKGNLKILFLVGFFAALSNILDFTARALTLVSFVIAIKRTSTIFSSLYGYFFFKEKEIFQRLPGIFVMLAGVILITLF